MDVSYLKKATGSLTATADISPKIFLLASYPGDIIVPIKVINTEGVLVTTADVRLYISEKKKTA